MSQIRTALIAVSTFVVTLGLQGCTADTGEDVGEDAPAVQVQIDSSNPTAYTPQVRRTDFVWPGGSCVGTTCTANGVSWDCKGGGLCTIMR
jgi:hypothetical protein